MKRKPVKKVKKQDEIDELRKTQFRQQEAIRELVEDCGGDPVKNHRKIVDILAEAIGKLQNI